MFRQFCIFRHRKSQFGLTFISIKACSKSILAQKCDFGPLELSLDPQQEHDLRNGVPKVWNCKTSTFPIGFLMKIYGDFIESQQNSLQICREGWQNRDDACWKVWKGLPKVSRNLVHVIKNCKCAKFVIFSKPSMGLVIYYASLHQFRKIANFHENPLQLSGDSYYFSDPEKIIIDFTPQNPL